MTNNSKRASFIKNTDKNKSNHTDSDNSTLVDTGNHINKAPLAAMAIDAGDSVQNKSRAKSHGLSVIGENDNINHSPSWRDIMSESKDISSLCRDMKLVSTPDLPSKSEAIEAVSLFLNKSYSVVFTGGKCAVLWSKLDEEDNEIIEYTTTSAMQTYLANRTVDFRAIDSEGNAKRKSIKAFDEWINCDISNRFEGITFSPLKKHNPLYLNLFNGWMVEPDRSSSDKCKKMLWHIESVICNGNKESFKYMMGWMSHMIQKPWEKPGVAVVMRSEEKGTGKSTIADVFIKPLMERAMMTTSNPKHILGSFNSHMADKILMVLEEAVFAGNPEADGILKDLITRSTITMERKHMDIIEVNSCLRLMLMTNSDWAVPVSKDERRYFVLDVSNKVCQNKEYFKALRDEMSDGGLEQMLAYFQNYDISDFDVREVPHTEGLRNQIELSMANEDKFLMQVLADGYIEEYTTEDGIPNDVFYESYLKFVKDTCFGKPVTKINLNKYLKKILSHTVATGQKVTEIAYGGNKTNRRLNGIKFLTIEECKMMFIHKLNLNNDVFQE